MTRARDVANIDTILTTKGDIYAASAAFTPTRLAVGDPGSTLVADSSTTTGLRWQGSQAAGRNAIINGAFDIWQRGTSIAGATSSSNYTADRWVGYRANTTISRQTTSDTTNLPFIQYAARVQRNSGQTFTTDVILATSLENADSTRFAGRTVTLSFYARAGANYSPTSSILVSAIGTGTGTDQNILAGFTGNVDYTQNNTLTTTWQRFTQTQAIPSSVTQIGMFFRMNPTGTAGANDWFEVTGVQLEIGSVATPFSRNAGTLAGELAACQRYYFRTVNLSNNAVGGSSDRITMFGTAVSTTEMRTQIQPPVVMRVAPTSIDYASLRAYDGAGFPTITSLTLGSSNSFLIEVITVGASYTQYRPTAIAVNGSNGYIGINAEL